MAKPKIQFSDFYNKIDIEALLSRLRYDPDTGRLWRLYNVTRNEWRIIKRKEHRVEGYVFVFNNIKVLAHDVVWMMHNDMWPSGRLEAINGNLDDTRIENLTMKRSTRDLLGGYFVQHEYQWGRFTARVYHEPYFRRQNSFNSRSAAEKWCKTQLRLYNQYAYAREEYADSSEAFELPIRDIWYHKRDKCYSVSVRFDGMRKHYCYSYNIEDAVEAKQIGQAEANEIWGENAAKFSMPTVVSGRAKIKSKKAKVIPNDVAWQKRTKKDKLKKPTLAKVSIQREPYYDDEGILKRPVGRPRKSELEKLKAIPYYKREWVKPGRGRPKKVVETNE